MQEPLIAPAQRSKTPLVVAGLAVLTVYVVVVALMWDHYGFSFDTEKEQPATLIMTVGGLAVSLYVLDWLRDSYKASAYREGESESEISEVDKKLQRPELDTLALEDFRGIVAPTVRQAARKTWEHEQRDSTAVQSDVLFNSFCANYAVQLLSQATSRCNVLSLVSLDAHYGSHSWQARMYRVLQSARYRVFLHLVVMAHILLAFAESADRSDGGLSSPFSLWRTLVESALLLVEILDVSLRLFFAFAARNCTENVLSPSFRRKQRILHAAIVGWMVFDLILQLTMEISLEYVVPVRPILLVLINDRAVESLIGFCASVVAAADLFGMYALFIVVCAILGTLHFHSVWSPDDDNDDVVSVKNRFANVVESFMSMFTYITTNENYSDVTYPGVEAYPTSIVFVVFMTILGSMLLVAMVTGVFENAFAEQQTAMLRRWRLFERAGIVAAHCLVDLDDSHEVSRQEFEGFVTALRPELRDSLQYDELDSDRNEQLDVVEFVSGCERLSVRRMFVPLPSGGSALANNETMRRVATLVTLLHMLALAFFHVLLVEDTVCTTVLLLFLGYHVLEVAVRVAALGANEFFFTQQYRKVATSEQVANRLDMLLVLLALAAMVAGFAGWIDIDLMHTGMALPIFRVLALLKSMRRFLFVLSHAYEPFGALLLLLFCVFFFFGTVAVTLFYGTFDDAVRRQLGYDAHFDSLGHSVLSLFQVFVGEAFHEIAYAAANATQQFAAIWFFLVFVIIVTTLFGGVLFGVILAVFGTLYDTMREEGRDVLTFTEILEAKEQVED